MTAPGLGFLTAPHEKAIQWFAANTGQETSWPSPIDGIYLANKAKGIHKPAGLPYALSVRQSLGSSYEDLVQQLPNGTWQFRYAQEGADPSYFTNRALANCMSEGVPVGVLLQIRGKPAPRYKVLGLGQVLAYEDGFFTIRQWSSAETPSQKFPVSESGFDPTDERDARLRMLRSITLRQGQPAFRQSLLKAYEATCAISGCRVIATLEAAHILPYHGVQTNYVENGILLRADIHTLFDLGACNIDPDSLMVRFDLSIQDPLYTVYEGKRLLLPKNVSDWPSRDALRARIARKTS